MVGWHHQLNGQEFKQTPGDSEGQGSLVCSSPWDQKESDMTYWRLTTIIQSCIYIIMGLCIFISPLTFIQYLLKWSHIFSHWEIFEVGSFVNQD